MKKKLLSLLLVLVLCVGVLPVTANAAATSGNCGDNLTWMVCKTDDATVNGTAYKLIISGTGDMYDFDWTDKQPWYQYNGHTHRSDGSTENGGNYITEVVIEPGVTHIGSSAFAEFCKVEQIIIPEGVKSIGTYAFQYNTSMKVTLTVSLESIKSQYVTPSRIEYNGCIHQWNSIEEKTWTSIVQCKPNTNQDDGDCTTALYCSVCGGVDIAAQDSHSFTNYVSNNDATCTADGTKTAHCDTVGCTATDTVTDEGSKTQHDFSDNAEYCRNDCGTKNPNYTVPVTPPYTPVRPTPTPVPTPVEPEQPEKPFNDVSKDDYFYHAVIWATEKEITKGTSATTFSPDDFCTRAQIVTFLYRYQDN